MRDIEKFRGCLIGGAAGDALGYAVEFSQAQDIFKKYGPNGITAYDLRHGIAEISDDTQMTLFTATGLLMGTTRGAIRGIMGPYPGYIAYSYQDWLKTQEKSYPLPDEYHYSWLVDVPELFSRRAPGGTCLSALLSDNIGSIDKPINNSKGCGGVMRVAPIGLYFNDKRLSIREIDTIGAEAAAITHGHELGYIPAAVLVHIIHRLSQDGCSVEDAVKDAMQTAAAMWGKAHHWTTFSQLITHALVLAQSSKPDLEAICELGEGWVAEETLAIAVYCALKYHDDFDKALIASVNHSGDSDSTGAVTGNILGAHLGLSAIPSKYLDTLELKDIILEIADDLWTGCSVEGEMDDSNPTWVTKYFENRRASSALK